MSYSRRLQAIACSLIVLVLPDAAPADAPRLLAVDDVVAVRDVDDPQISPDGRWVAYTVTEADPAQDEFVSHVWMTSWDGERSLRLTHSDDGESMPRFSPDGRYLAFLSARGGEDEPTQLWLMNRTGGEGRAATGFGGDVLDYAWSPDGRHVAMIVRDEDPNRHADDDETPPPIVIDRFYFKEDVTGYLTALRQHLYVLDVESGKTELLTPGDFDEAMPAWSPDGAAIAFYSKRFGDPDRTTETGLYVMAPEPGAKQRLVARFFGDEGYMSRPSWRPDGREILFTATREPKLLWYSRQHVLAVSAAGGEPRVVTADIDRNVLEPRWSPDGRRIHALLEDDRNRHLVRLDPKTGEAGIVVGGRRETTGFDVAAGNRIVIRDSTVERPFELLAVDGRNTRRLTSHNDDWLAGVSLGAVREVSFTSRDGTRISGFIVTPPGYEEGRRYPAILRIHGGPVSQYANAFDMEWQIFAAHGYVVVAANPRGSSGRGEDFAAALFGEWGGVDTDDVLAAVDYAVAEGYADPERLGVGGWSYGGILTDVVIAKDQRFKAATSGSSMGNALAGYGTDMYIREWEAELGTPWENLDAYLRNAYPLLNADDIVTPTLFLCGNLDFNVPLLNSEQMYQALRSLGVDTELVIYPDQYHSLTKPSYWKDEMQRYIDWYGRYLD